MTRQALYRGRAHLTLAVEEWRISGYLALVYRTASVLLCPRARLALRRAAIAAAVAARAQVDKGASLVHEGAVGAGARPRHADHLAGGVDAVATPPGYAMKGTDRSLMLGAVLGKALEPLASDTGVIRVLVALQ